MSRTAQEQTLTDNSDRQPLTLKECLQIAIIRAVLGAQNGLLRVLNRVLFRRPAPSRLDAVRRIAVYRIGNIGDVLAATPALKSIRDRFPCARIVLITSPGMPGAPGARELLTPGVWFDELFYYDGCDLAGPRRVWSLVRCARALECELFVELSNVLSGLRNELKSTLFARAMGCRYAVGMRLSQVMLFSRVQSVRMPQQNERIRMLKSIERDLQLKPPGDVLLPADQALWPAIRQKLGGSLDRNSYVVLHPGGKRPLNRWPEERFAAMARHIVQQYGLTVVVTGGPSEDQICRRLAASCPQVLNAGGCLSLPELMVLMKNASLYLGNDTGPMHIACGVGTPTVGIFSARDHPQQWYPFGANTTVLRQDVPCSPCFAEVCPNQLKCLDLIRTEDVIAGVQAQLTKCLPVPAGASAAGLPRSGIGSFSTEHLDARNRSAV